MTKKKKQFPNEIWAELEDDGEDSHLIVWRTLEEVGDSDHIAKYRLVEEGMISKNVTFTSLRKG